jgi:hypothetical protein
MSTEVTVKGSSMKQRLVRAALVVPALLGAVWSSSCASDTVREGRGGSYLIIEALEGASGCEDSPIFTTVLRADVLCTGVAEDLGRVRMRLGLKDIGTVTNPNSPTTNNFITVNRYHVVFRRSDGRNQPGVDVPYAFDGGLTFTIGTAAAEGVFALVRVNAKLEAPALALRGLGGAVVIATLADITFYGRDQAGNDVTVMGTISVNFADWADPE